MDIPASPTAMPAAARTRRGYRPAPLRATRRHALLAPLSFTTAPMLLCAAGFSFGIFDTRWVWHPPLLCALAALLGALLTLASLRYAERVLFLPLLLVWVAIGQFSAFVNPPRAASPNLIHLADRLQRQVTGTVIALHPVTTKTRNASFSDVQFTEETEQVDLALDTAEDFTSERDWQAPVHGGLRLTIYAKPEQLSGVGLPIFHCGEHIGVTTRMYAPDHYLDPGAWDYPAYLRQHGIDVLGGAEVASITRIPAARAFSLPCLATQAQLWAGARLEQIAARGAAIPWLPAWLRLRPDDADILRAMLFGDRSHLRRALRTGFERTGSFHLLVVSGLHVTIVIGLFFWIARTIGWSEVTATAIALSCALPYAFLTGFGPPVQRALWLSGVYLLCRIFYRERAAVNAVAIAALGILVRTPSALFDASFQMTFLAILAIAGVAAPLIEASVAPYLRGLPTASLLALDPHLPPRVTQLRVSLRMWSDHLRPLIGKRWAKSIPVFLSLWTLRVAEALLVSLVVELAMILPMAIYFHRVTLYALPANLLGLPLLGVLLPLALLTFLLSCIQATLALPFASLTALLMHTITFLVSTFNSLSSGGARIPDPPLWSILFFCTAWVLAIWMVRAQSHGRFLALAIIFLGSICIFFPQHPDLHPGVLEITALDVGQGDSIFVVTPDGHTLLIDAGGPIGAGTQTESNFDVGEEVVSQYLWSRHIRRLDVVALTHAHSDHMGGMPAVLENFRPQTLWVGNNPPVAAYLALLATAKAQGIAIESWHAGQEFSFGNTRVQVLAPATGYAPGKQPSNDDSLVLRMAYKQTAVLLEGDAEARTENAMVARGITAAALLKVGHHGSSTSTTPAFLAAVAPTYAVISDGRNNPFGHPRVSVLEALGRAHVRVYRTDTLGLRSFFLDGRTVCPESNPQGTSAP